MASNINTWGVPILLIIACITLFANLLNTNKMNKTLTEEFEIKEGNLALSIADATAKTGQVGSLTAQLKETVVSKTALQAEVDRLTAELAAFKAALQAEVDRLSAEIAAFKAATEHQTEADFNEAAPAESA